MTSARLLLAALAAIAALALPSSAAAKAPIPRPSMPRGLPVVYGPCPVTDAAGCMWQGTLYVWRKSDVQTERHEIGHWVDTHYLSDGERNRFMTLAKITDQPWWPTTTEAQLRDRASGTEQFADAYAHCSLGDDPGGHPLKSGGVRFSWWQSTPFRPGRAAYVRVCGFIVRAMKTEDGPEPLSPYALPAPAPVR